jgi:hypothetical protein
MRAGRWRAVWRWWPASDVKISGALARESAVH